MVENIPDDLTIQQLRKMIVEVYKETYSVKIEFNTLLPQPLKAGKIQNRKETAKTLNISLPTLNQWTKNGKINGYRIGIYIIYMYEDIIELIRCKNSKGKK
jgi:hypothetical protein